MTDTYPHESPILMGMLMVVIGIFIIVWRLYNPWIPDCPSTALNGIYTLCDEMDYIPILGCFFGIVGISLILTDLMPGDEE